MCIHINIPGDPIPKTKIVGTGYVHLNIFTCPQVPNQCKHNKGLIRFRDGQALYVQCFLRAESANNICNHAMSGHLEDIV